MITNPGYRGVLLCLIVVILNLSSTVALTHPGQARPSGDLSVVGEVTVNGASAISGATVFSDCTITTAKGSSAVVSLGKLGRVEVLPESSLKLSFDNSGITVAMLEAGRVRVSSSSGTAATVNTRDGKVVANTKEANIFKVDTVCRNTLVATEKGAVELRAAFITRIPAGSDLEVGTPQGGCKR